LITRTIMNLNKYKLLISAISTLFISYLSFGFYFERYEPLAVSLISGVFTPGMLYDDFFYLAHIGIVKLFAYLFAYFPNIAWLSVFQYTYLLIAYILIINVFGKLIKSKVGFMLFLLGFSIFFMEYYVLHVMTRVSYILSFSVLLQLMYSFHKGSLGYKTFIGLCFMFLLAVLIRPEPPSIMGLIVGLFYVVTYPANGVWAKVKNTFSIFIMPALLCTFAVLWVFFSIQKSDEFYMQIEPEVEYELMARNNFVPISQMENERDSLRYEAIYLGIWGDATTNNASFLRSLIGEDHTNLSYLIENAKSSIDFSAKNCLGIFYLHISSFAMAILLLLIVKPIASLRLFVFELIFGSIIFLMSFKVKMVETSLSPMLFAGTLLIYFYFFQQAIKWRFLIFIPIIGFSIYQLGFLARVVESFEKDYLASKEIRQQLEDEYPSKKLFIDRIAFEFLFRGFKPFQILKFEKLGKLYLFDSQHLSTVQPYKKYLQQDCHCDPNNYQEYWSYILREKTNSVIFIDKNNARFYQEYLNKVHQVSTTWRKTDFKESLGNRAGYMDKLDFFELE